VPLRFAEHESVPAELKELVWQEILLANWAFASDEAVLSFISPIKSAS
jgi:hypothetical protein